MSYISEISAAGIEGVQMGGGESADQLGAHYPFSFNAGGLSIDGRMIVVKSDAENLWMVWHNPRMFHVQRWGYKEVEEGMKMSLVSETQIVESLNNVPGIDKITKELLKDLDMYFAHRLRGPRRDEICGRRSPHSPGRRSPRDEGVLAHDQEGRGGRGRDMKTRESFFAAPAVRTQRLLVRNTIDSTFFEVFS